MIEDVIDAGDEQPVELRLGGRGRLAKVLAQPGERFARHRAAGPQRARPKKRSDPRDRAADRGRDARNAVSTRSPAIGSSVMPKDSVSGMSAAAYRSSRLPGAPCAWLRAMKAAARATSTPSDSRSRGAASRACAGSRRRCGRVVSASSWPFAERDRPHRPARHSRGAARIRSQTAASSSPGSTRTNRGTGCARRRAAPARARA